MILCTECGHRLDRHSRARNGAFRCRSFGCGCEIASIDVPREREKGDDDGVEYGDPRERKEES